MAKMSGVLRALLFLACGFVAGWISAVMILRNAIERQSEVLFERGVSLSDLDGPWPAGLSEAYIALDDRKQAAIYFLLAAADLNEANRHRSDLYLGLLHQKSDPCKAETYLQRAERQGVKLDEFRSLLDEARAACGKT